MKKLHVYALKPHNSYGGEFRVNNLAFYTRNDEKLEVTDIVHVNDNEATFKLNGVNGRIQVPIPYSGYYPKNVFTTDTSESYTLMVKGNTNAAIENKGFYISFDQDVYFEYITLAYCYSNPKDFVFQLDDEPVSEPVNADKGTVFKINMPKSRFRCFVGNDGLYYFLRPEDVSPPSEVPAAEGQV